MRMRTNAKGLPLFSEFIWLLKYSKLNLKQFHMQSIIVEKITCLL